MKRKFFFSLIAGFFVTAVVFFYESANSSFSAASRLQKFCDGTFVSAVIFFCAGGFLFCKNKKLFNGIVYGTKQLFSRIFSRNKSGSKSYLEFSNESKETGKDFILIFFSLGIFFLLTSVALLIFSVLLKLQ